MAESLGILTEEFPVGGGGGPTTLPVFQTAGTRFQNASAAPAIAVPAGVASGDFIIIAMFVDGATTGTVTPPAGFSHHPLSPVLVNAGGTNQHKLAVLYKVASGADTGTYTVTLSASVFVYGRSFRYTNVNATPWDGGVSAQSGNVNVATTPAVSMTPAGPNRKLLTFATDWNGDGGTWGALTGWTQREGGASVTNVFLADKDFAVAAASGAVTFSCGSGRAGAMITGLVGV